MFNGLDSDKKNLTQKQNDANTIYHNTSPDLIAKGPLLEVNNKY